MVIDQEVKNNYAVYNSDCIDVMKKLPDEKIHLSVYSPPFGGLYHYSSDEKDLSNSSNYNEFFEHYAYVVKELFRLTLPGRISAVHCADIPSSNTGNDYLIDLPGDIIKLHDREGFKLICRHIVWKEPLWVRRRTMTHNLSHRTIIDDAAYGGVASADQVLIFRKIGENKIPVTHPTGLDYYAGQCPIPENLLKYRGWKGDQKQNLFSHFIWRRYASSVWDDINMSNVLPFQDCKDPDDEKHVHPLQLDIIDRIVSLRTNPGETVLTPFMGVGSEVYSALKNSRKGIGIELKQSYYRQALKNIQNIKNIEEQVSIDFESDDESELIRP